MTQPEQVPFSGPNLQLALRSANIGVWTWDATRGMVASDECWGLWGVSRNDSTDGNDWTSNIHPDDRDRLTTRLQDAAAGCDTFCEEYRVTLPEGHERCLLSVGRAADATHTVVGITRDVSERSEADQVRGSLAAIVASCDDAIVGKSLDGTITSWNAAAERIFGYDAPEIIGRNVTVLIPPDRQDEEQEFLIKLRAGQRVDHYESKRRRKDGRIIDVSLTISPVHDKHGRVVGASKVARDITAAKQVQEREQETNRQKDAFLAILAHELRNPLAPIRSAVSILGLQSSGQHEMQAARTIIDRQVDQLVHLIDDLLDISRMTLGRIQLRPGLLDLRDAAREALTSSEPLLNDGRHEVTFSTPPYEVRVMGDWVRLVQVLSNLFNNAARYTPPGGRVQIDIRSESGNAVVTVTDSGVGITSDALPHVFDRFLQSANPLVDGQDGLGVGLSLSRKLVELHNGTLTVQSEGAGRGSRFTMRIPLTPDEDDVGIGADMPDAARDGHHYRFLVVDDNADAADSQALLLRLLGHEAWAAYDGVTALEMAREHLPDVILLDLGMPGMDGFEVAGHLRMIPQLSDVLLIAQTGWGQIEFKERTALAGFDAHLTKPLDLRTLMDVLDTRGANLH